GFVTERKEASVATGEPVTRAQLIARLAYLDPDCDRDDWRNHVASIHATPLKDGDAFDIACRWSRGEYDRLGRNAIPSKFTGDEDVRKVFDTMPPKDGGRAFGSIDKAARDAGFDGPRAQPSGEEIFAKAVLPTKTEAKGGEITNYVPG